MAVARSTAASLRPPSQRYTIAALMLAAAVAPLIGMLSMAASISRASCATATRLELTALGLFGRSVSQIPISDLQAREYDGKMARARVSVNAPWITLRVDGPATALCG